MDLYEGMSTPRQTSLGDPYLNGYGVFVLLAVSVLVTLIVMWCDRNEGGHECQLGENNDTGSRPSQTTYVAGWGGVPQNGPGPGFDDSSEDEVGSGEDEVAGDGVLHGVEDDEEVDEVEVGPGNGNGDADGDGSGDGGYEEVDEDEVGDGNSSGGLQGDEEEDEVEVGDDDAGGHVTESGSDSEYEPETENEPGVETSAGSAAGSPGSAGIESGSISIPAKSAASPDSMPRLRRSTRLSSSSSSEGRKGVVHGEATPSTGRVKSKTA
jgi:hypothetical protein